MTIMPAHPPIAAMVREAAPPSEIAHVFHGMGISIGNIIAEQIPSLPTEHFFAVGIENNGIGIAAFGFAALSMWLIKTMIFNAIVR
ncbi:hypothetical protein [Acidiphilium sp. PM]|uniref:hypothetical protein n=1 Tax=Acidiphilium sp. PM TaxID=1043206 RepID=UPI00110FB309|nr:hypothetical protein [Acidiphilium sp. PM]